MKKLFYLLSIILISGLIILGCSELVVSQVEKEEETSFTKAKPIKLSSVACYKLNIVGKKIDWNSVGNYNNWNRHTMFVPEDTAGLIFGVGRATFSGIKISMTQGSEFAVLDGNAFDDNECVLQLASGEYDVYILTESKPEGYNNITGWVYTEDEKGKSYWYNHIGSVHVTKNIKWKDATQIFYVSDSEDRFGLVGTEDILVFNYMDVLEGHLGDNPAIPGEPYTEYFWQYINHGNKLVKIQFYEK